MPPKPWLQNLQPNLALGSTILSLTPTLLETHQLKGLILDVDDTLVPFHGWEAPPEITQWLEPIRPLAQVWLVSNNPNAQRIGGIAQALGVPYLYSAGKPSRRKLRQAIAAMNLPVTEVAMVGDRLFTDVLAGNRLGMFTILVEPIIPQQLSLRNLEVWLGSCLGISLAKQK